MHILLIEPDILLASTYTRAFEIAEHSVTHAPSAQSAIYAADTNKPDVVVLELQMAAHNGVAFLHEFRSYAEWQSVPVILHTYAHPARHGDIRAQLTDQFGINVWLYKPQTTLQDLVAAVRLHTPQSAV